MANQGPQFTSDAGIPPTQGGKFEVIQERLRLAEMGALTYRVLDDGIELTPIEEINASQDRFKGVLVHVAGKLLTLRPMKRSNFADVGHTEPGSHIQAVWGSTPSETHIPLSERLATGDIVYASGEVGNTGTGELSIFTQEPPQILTPTLHPQSYVRKGADGRYGLDYKDPWKGMAELRNGVWTYVHNFMQAHAYTHLDTAILQKAGGGANARTFETRSKDGDPLHLRIAPEIQLKMALVNGMQRVYEMGHNFRNEGLESSRSPEFSSLEFYTAYASPRGMRGVTQKLLRSIVESQNAGSSIIHTPVYSVDERGGRRLNNIVEVDFNGKWPVLSFGDLFKAHLGVDLNSMLEHAHGRADQAPKLKGELLRIASSCNRQLGRQIFNNEELTRLSIGSIIDTLYKRMIRPTLQEPVWVTDYPAFTSPLARPFDKAPWLVDQSQLVIAGTEYVKLYQELTDPHRQWENFRAQTRDRAQGDDEAMMMDTAFITALAKGMPPATGVGIGIDRLLMLISGASSINEVIPFPYSDQIKGK